MKAFVFDLFHTLVDPEDFSPPGYSRHDAIASVLGVDPVEMARYWDATWTDCEAADKSVAEHLASFARSSGADPTANRLALVEELAGRYQNAAIAAPRRDVLGALDELGRGYRLAMLSNCFAAEVTALADSPLARRFEAIGLSYRIGHTKPAPEAYAWALEALGLPASECAFVGNGGSGELEGAVDAGFGWVVHHDGFDASNGHVPPTERARRSAAADHRVESIHELVAAVPKSAVRRHRL